MEAVIAAKGQLRINVHGFGMGSRISLYRSDGPVTTYFWPHSVFDTHIILYLSVFVCIHNHSSICIFSSGNPYAAQPYAPKPAGQYGAPYNPKPLGLSVDPKSMGKYGQLVQLFLLSQVTFH